MLTSQPIRPAAVIIWVLIQLAALGIGSGGTPLWAHHPRPAESIGADEMMVVQISAAAMLFPFLFPNFSTTLAAIALAWPFLQLAGWLSATAASNLLGASLFVSLWIAGLACCWAATRAEANWLGWCAASMWTLGGVVLWYLHCEAVDFAAARLSMEYFGPIFCGLAQLRQRISSPIVWITAATPIAFAGVWSLTKKNFNSM